MRKMRTVLLALAAVVCFAAAYRFASHGIKLNDNKCLGLACIALVVGGVMLWFAFLKKRRQQNGISN